MSKMRRKNKKHKPPQSQNIEQETQPANSDSSDTDSILTVNNVESYFLNRNIAIPNLHNIVLQMKRNKKENEPFEGQIEDPQTTATTAITAIEQQPSTSGFQATEANKDEISSDKNESKSEASRSVRRRRIKKERFAQEQNSETPKMDENPDEKQTEMPANSKSNKKARKNARRRQKSTEVNKEPEVDAGEPSQASNVSDHVPSMRRNSIEKENASIPEMDTISICNVPASMVIKKAVAKEKELLYFRKPDYENCDYYAYDYETLEECAEELGSNETIEITIDCTEYVPMFAEYIPIRHYFENTRVVRLVERSLLDSANPLLPLPVELFPDKLTAKEQSDENKIDDVATVIKKETEEPKNNPYKDDEIWFSWLDPMSSKEIKQEVISDENVTVENNETFEANTAIPENIQIKSELVEDDTVDENSFESKVSNTEVFKNMALRIFQVERDLKTLENNMSDFKKTMDQLKKLPFFSALEKEEGTSKKLALTQENKSVESQTETVDENQETQTEPPNQNQEKLAQKMLLNPGLGNLEKHPKF